MRLPIRALVTASGIIIGAASVLLAGCGNGGTSSAPGAMDAGGMDASSTPSTDAAAQGGDENAIVGDAIVSDAIVSDVTSGGSEAGLGADAAVADSGNLDAGPAGVVDGAYSPIGEGTYLEPAVDAGDSVLRHHKNLNHDGAYIEPALTKAAVIGNDAGLAGLHQDTNFHAVLPDPNDEVYAQPLFVDGLGGQDMVIVATEGDNVYALDAATGIQLWATNVGAPVPSAVLLDFGSCGDQDEYGITGTPVIDYASRTVFFDAEILAGGADAGAADDGGDAQAPTAVPKHEIFALSIDTGLVRPGWPVDVGAIAIADDGPFNPLYQGQSGGLAILDGTLYVAFGGLFGSCGDYHGWVVAVPIADPAHVQTWSTPAPGAGASASGGIASDGTAIFVATGTGFRVWSGSGSFCDQTSWAWAGDEAIVRFGVGSAFGAPQDYFAPYDWLALDCQGSAMNAGPVPFDLPNSNPGKLAISFGTDGKAYLLDRTRLGGVGDSLLPDAGDAAVPVIDSAGLRVSTATIVTAPAVYTTATATYVALYAAPAPALCAGTDFASWALVPGSPPTLSFAWCALAGAGSPIATTSDGQSDAIVWQLGVQGDNRLHAFDGDTGAVLHFPGAGVTIPNMRRYNAPIAAKGRIYVPADGQIVAFTP
jgi:outer membrane protein assembly factor BamB